MNSNNKKPEDCIICLDPLSDKDILECGHKIHLECVKKHFKPECPICRKQLNIKVTGKYPEPNEQLDYDLIENLNRYPYSYPNNNLSFEHKDLNNDFIGLSEDLDAFLDIIRQVSDLRNYRITNFFNNYNNNSSDNFVHRDLHIEMDTNLSEDNEKENSEDIDEENPHGDDWNYEDV